MLLDKETMTTIIPQKAPFVMIDNLLTVDDKGFTSTFKVEENNLFFKEDKLQEPALIENIAQTVAAGFGYVDKQNRGAPKLGFIGSIAKLELYHLPSLGEEINTIVTHLHQFENIYLVKGESYSKEVLLLVCEMKIVVQE